MSIRGYDQWKTASPYDDEGPCEVCGKVVDDCICPECPECGAAGDPECYERHGLVRTPEQIAGLKELEEWMRREAEAEAQMWKERAGQPEESMFDEEAAK